MTGLLASDVTRTVQAFEPGGDGEALKSRDLNACNSRLGRPSRFPWMTYAPGHVTCTGVVLGRERDRVLLVHHRRLKRWLLPGGHCEAGDLTIDSVAKREVIEETGLDCRVSKAAW